MTDNWQPTGVDTQTPSTARMYDYYLGGKHHYPADREAAATVLQAIPDIPVAARENRAFLKRAVRAMAASGVRQFIDVGTGLPTQENVHQVAQQVAPDARVVYVDSDPVALAHARALLATDAQTVAVDADMRHPQQVVTDPAVRDMIDFNEPIGLLFVLVLHFVTDEEDPAALVADYRDRLPAGSYIAVSHVTADEVSADAYTAGKHPYERATSTINPRTQRQIQKLFAGLEVLDPGVVAVGQWRPDSPDSTTADSGDRTLAFAGVGRKP